MQPVILSNPVSSDDEITIIHGLFDAGLELFHVRKPDYTEEEYRSFLACIHLHYRNRLVVHQFHEIAAEFGVNRLHFSEQKRKEITDWSPYSGFIVSASVHSIDDFNALPDCVEYAFLSPVFPSISKPGYVSEVNLPEEVKKRTNTRTQLIALGGITAENRQIALDSGFDNVALLGAIWNSDRAIENYRACQTNFNTYRRAQQPQNN